MLERDKVEKIVIIRSAVEIRSIGFLPGDHSEKLDVYAAPYIHLINELSPKKNYRALVGAKEIEFHSTSFLRGMTFDYSYIIADEYQNMNKHELETIITRVGDGTQLVLCGDSDQTDLKYQEAVEHKEVIETLKLMPDFAHYEFTSDEIVRSEFVKRYYQAKEGTLTTPNFLTRTARANGG
jgi:phosphate starvation-inducible PhoH-like protein